MTTDLSKEYVLAKEYLLQVYNVNISHILCRVHMFMSFRGQRHGLAIAINKRKYFKNPLLVEWEQRFRNLIFNSFDEDSYKKIMNIFVN